MPISTDDRLEEAASHPAIAASFRDPAGRLFAWKGRILRSVNVGGVDTLAAVASSHAVASAIGKGAVIGMRVLDRSERDELLREPAVQLLCGESVETVVEHPRIPFPSFPYEWPPEMLHAAALTTLDLALQLLPENIGLKDATPYNILFRGPDPVFVDLLSFERRDPRDPSWLPYAQFIRTFLLPLLANKRFGHSLDQLLLTRRDGIEPDAFYQWLTPWQRLTPSLLSLVSLPCWLGKRRQQDDTTLYRRRLADDPEKAAFILRCILQRLRRQLLKAAPAAGKASVWSDYLTANNNYSAQHFAAKQAFVESTLARLRPTRVLDVGCNTGSFSALAARSGSAVVAIDYDPVVVGELWRRASAEHLDILPLVVNLTRPTPATGWRNRECASFLDRARGGFDMVFMLAVLHHMLVTERIPLDEIVDLAADLTTRSLIIEFIAPEDSMFQRLSRGRDDLHRDLTVSSFETALQRRFEIESSSHVDGTFRWLYCLKKRTHS